MKFYKIFLIKVFLMFLHFVSIAQIDTVKIEGAMKIVHDTIQKQPLECERQKADNLENSSLFENVTYGFKFPVPNKQAFREEITADNYVMTFGDNIDSMENAVITSLIFYKKDSICANQLFEKDFLSFVLADKKVILSKDAGKIWFGNQMAFWIKVTQKESIGISENLIFYFVHPIQKNAMTIMVSTYSEYGIEDKLCERMAYLEHIDFY